MPDDHILDADMWSGNFTVNQDAALSGNRNAFFVAPTEGRCQVKNFRAYVIGILLGALVCTPAWCGPDLTNYQLTFIEYFHALSLSNSTAHDGARWYPQTVACCMQDSTGIGAYLYTGQSGVSRSFSLIQDWGLKIRLTRQNNAWIGGLTGQLIRTARASLLVDFGVGGGWPTDPTRNPSDMQVQYANRYRAPRPM
jgi:hypothetical protein